MDFLSGLNPSQKEAALWKEGPLLVVAGAGAGKTRTLTARISALIQSGVLPSRILAVTFTNKAASEMRSRIRTLLGHSASSQTPFFGTDEPWVGTFHSLGVRILRENGSGVGVPKNFTIKDREGALSILKDAMRTVACDPKRFEPRRIQGTLSRQKGELRSAQEYLAEKGDGFVPQTIASVWEEYEKLLQKEKAVDFDDLIRLPVVLLQTKKEVRAHYRDKWHYAHIDEYQDTNKAQYTLSRLLAEPRNNIFAVGDVDQNVYGWRGSSIRNILNFEKDYPNTKTILLEENYRSSGTILRAANEVISKNRFRIEKNLFTKNGDGEKIALSVAPDEKSEAFGIVNATEGIVEKGALHRDIAVLYRANFQSRALEEAFLARAVPYHVIGVRFFERKEVQDILAFLNAARNPESLGDIKRIINVPTRGIGKATVAKIFSGMKGSLPEAMRARADGFFRLLSRIEKASQEKKPSELVLFILTESGMKKALESEGEEGMERMENIRELAGFAKRYDARPQETALASLLEDAALASDQDELREDRNGVRLMTVHAAKGLEFPYVFVTGLEQGLFPHEPFGDGGGLSEEERNEEERRLFYVALTRAAKKLFLSYAETRTIFGSRGHTVPSAFLTDIPQELIELDYGGSQGEEGLREIEID